MNCPLCGVVAERRGREFVCPGCALEFAAFDPGTIAVAGGGGMLIGSEIKKETPRAAHPRRLEYQQSVESTTNRRTTP